MSDPYAGREPVATHRHERPWVADLETPDHAHNRQLTVAEAVDAVEQTSPGQFVDLVTHERHGHPSSYLDESVRSVERHVDIIDEGKCSCGGYVTRITVSSPD